MFQSLFMEANMFSLNLLEEAGSSSGTIWVPILVLGWFLVMTLVGWQVSRRKVVEIEPQPAGASHSEDNPSEFDSH
jgi:hypothetical protein